MALGYFPKENSEIAAQNNPEALDIARDYSQRMNEAQTGAEQFGLGVRGNMAVGVSNALAMGRDIAEKVKPVTGFFSGLYGSQPSTSPSAPSQSGGAALTNSGLGSMPAATQAQPSAPATTAQPKPVGYGLNGKPLQGAAAAAFQGYQPNGTPIFGGDSKSLAGVQPASGHFNQANADAHAAMLARQDAQYNASRLRRIQDEQLLSHNPAVVQAAMGMTPAVGAANDRYNELIQMSQAPGGLGNMTPSMKQQLAFEQAKIGLQNATPQGQMAAMALDKQRQIESWIKQWGEEKDPKKRAIIDANLTALGVKRGIEQQARSLGQFTTAEGGQDGLIEVSPGVFKTASSLAMGAQQGPLWNLELPPKK